MMIINAYVVTCIYEYDSSGADIIYTTIDRKEAEYELYKEVVRLSIETGEPIKRFPYDESAYEIGGYLLQIEQHSIKLD